MQYSTLLYTLAIGALTQVAAFNAKTDSCVPIDNTFKEAASPNYVKCPLSSGSDYVLRYDCGDVGFVYHSYLNNQVRLVNKMSNVDRQFAIHGACLENGSQVAHIDLYTPIKAGVIFDRTFHGLNRVCNVFGPTYRVLALAAYTLDDKQLNACGQHPIKPLKQS